MTEGKRVTQAAKATERTGTMPRRTPSSRTMVSVVRLLVVALFAAGCALVQPPAPEGPLVTVEATGGLCPGGMCRSVIAIESDGLAHQIEPVEAEIHRATNEAIDAYRAALAVTSFDVIRSRPFTGVCPIAFDGQELIYTFATSAGPERISSCEVEIEPEDPLFAAVNAMLGADLRLPE